jgi:hypothetical protein
VYIDFTDVNVNIGIPIYGENILFHTSLHTIIYYLIVDSFHLDYYFSLVVPL